MSLPAAFMSELRSRIPLSQVVGRKVVWDVRRSNQAKGDFWAPCPFHQEKTASFHVDDRKGFYYCFGCHAKGDALSFLCESEKLSFMEAVKTLAHEAGMTLPQQSPQMAQKQAELTNIRSQLIDVLSEARKWFSLQLQTSIAADARSYLKGRGLSSEAQERWQIGFAPLQRQALFQALRQKGFDSDIIVQSGVCAKADDGSIYDRFRERIIFPIHDPRGRVISFGGRSLDPQAKAKYLNGPETILFDKGRNLFNLGPACDALAKEKDDCLIIAEGYMDVIALSEAGFRQSVAPLGTAITADQLHLAWRFCNEPVLALDGDSAGIRAALKVVELALPIIEAGKGIRFAMMPSGLDPDDVIRTQGAQAMQQVIKAALPMVSLLWQRETEGKIFDSPERRAALDKRLRATLKTISDPLIRNHYGEKIKSLRAALFQSKTFPTTFVKTKRGYARDSNRFDQKNIPPREQTKQSLIAREQNNFGSSNMPDIVREAVVIAGCLYHPSLIERFECELEKLECSDPFHAKIRNFLLTHQGKSSVIDELSKQSVELVEKIQNNPHVRSMPTIQPWALINDAEACIAETFIRLQADRAYRSEIQSAEDDPGGAMDEAFIWRVSQASKAKHEAALGAQETRADVVRADNGVSLDKDELENASKTFDSIDFSRTSSSWKKGDKNR